MPSSPAKTKLKRQEIVGLVAQHLLQEGFRNSGLRALAKSIPMSDRMVIYYFGSKDALVSEALLLLADGLAASLESVLPDQQASGAKIVKALVDSALVEESRPMLRLWFEIVGLAVRGDEPYKTTAGLFLARWEEWISGKLEPKQRHRALALLAQVEGEVMIHLLRE